MDQQKEVNKTNSSQRKKSSWEGDNTSCLLTRDFGGVELGTIMNNFKIIA